MPDSIHPSLLATGLAAALLGLTATHAADDPHAHHQMQMHHPAGHTAHQAMMGGNDPHAHHRAMMAQADFQLSEHAYLPGDATLVGMGGERVSLSEALDCDKPVMANFIFTTCTTICPVMSATFAQVQSILGSEADDVCMVSISIDPEHDTPQRLREYAQRFDAGPNWHFYTGDLADIVAAQKSFDVYRGNKMNHEPTTLMRRADGEPWVRIDGLASAAEIVGAYRDLIHR